MNLAASISPFFSTATRADVQGFVTSSFGHLPQSAYLFARVDEPAAAGRWLEEILPEVTTAASWRVRPDAPKERPPRTLNVAFTAAGLRALGLSDWCVGTFPAEFVEGMASDERARILGDTGSSAPARWQFGHAANPVHAVFILSADSPNSLRIECGRLRASATGTAGMTIVSEEFGSRPHNDKEPFGFRDGMGQPEIKGIKSAGVSAGEFILGHINEYGFHSVGPVLPAADDPHELLQDSANPYHAGLRDFGLNGSFVVYRKLEQDVAGFWRFLEAESRRRAGEADPRFMIWLAAKMVGRWPGGAPLALAPEHDDPALRDTDNFLYAEADPEGQRCPFGAHIRRANPRDQLRPAGSAESLNMSARHRILRRGKPYGPPLFDLDLLDGPPDREVLQALLDLRDDGQSRGLHFFCVNASIKSQFEFIQQAWLNNPHFNGVTDNRDPLTGENGGPGDRSSMLVPRADLDLRTAPLPRFITVRAGAYFFMPGLRALKYLAAIPRAGIRTEPRER